MGIKVTMLHLPKKNNRCKRFHETKSYYNCPPRCNQFEKLKPISRNQLLNKLIPSWRKDNSIVVVLRCRVCGTLNVLRYISDYQYCEKCDSEIIYNVSINYLYATPIYKNKNIIVDKYKVIVQDYD